MNTQHDQASQRHFGSEHGHDSGSPTRQHQTVSATHHAFSLSGRQQQTFSEIIEKSSKFLGLLDGIITSCIALLFFGIPLFFTGLTFQGIAFEKQIFFYALLLVALVAWTTKGVISGEMRIRRTPLDIPLLAFLAVYTLATFFSADRWHSFWGFFGDPSHGLMNVIALIVAYYIVVSHFTLERSLKFSWALAISNFIAALWSFLLVMGVKPLSDKLAAYFPISTLGSVSSLGIYLGLMLPVITTLILSLKSEKKTAKTTRANLAITFLFAALILDIILLLVLYSFISWLGVLVGVSVFLVYVLARIIRPADNWTWVPMVMFVAILTILMIGSNSLARVALPVEISPSYSLSWDIAKESLKHSFLIGNGPAIYGNDFSAFHTKEFNLEQLFGLRFYQGTGIFFEILATAGILGGIVLILIALTYIGSGAYMLSTNKAKNKLMSLGFFSASLVLLINVFAAKAEGSILIIGTMLGALAMATLLTESDSHQGFLTLSLKASPKYALALAFIFMVVSAGVVFLFVFVGKVFIADIRAGEGVREKEITEKGSIAKIANGISWNNHEGRYFTRLGQEYLVLANKEALKTENERNVNTIRDYLQSSIILAKRGRDMMPTDALAQETLAQAYENAGLYIPDSLTLAEEAYKKALELEPHNPLYMVKLGLVKIAQASAKNNPQDLKQGAQDAKDWFQKAIDEKPNLASAYYQMSFANELLADTDSAITSMEKALVAENDNLSYAFNLARLHQIRGNDEDKKIAEAIYKKILENNKNDINTHFSLGLLYEKKKQPNDATNEYKTVLSLLDSSNKDTKAQVQKMIDNVARGIENTPETIKTDLAAQQNQAGGDNQPQLVNSGQ